MLMFSPPSVPAGSPAIRLSAVVIALLSRLVVAAQSLSVGPNVMLNQQCPSCTVSIGQRLAARNRC
jgi:hypothetical protein